MEDAVMPDWGQMVAVIARYSRRHGAWRLGGQGACGRTRRWVD